MPVPPAVDVFDIYAAAAEQRERFDNDLKASLWKTWEELTPSNRRARRSRAYPRLYGRESGILTLARGREHTEIAGEPRKHHVVSAFHLAGFTDSRARDGRLFAFDKNHRKTWPSSPDQAARETDFNRIEVDGVDAMMVERGFGDFESDCAPILRSIIDTRQLPTGDALNTLLAYVTLATLRVPWFRKVLSGFNDQVMKQLTRLSYLGTDGAMRARRLFEVDGRQVSESDVSEFQAAVASDSYKMDFEQTWHIGTMLQGIDVVTFLLKKRNWSLWICDDDAPDQICSDCPVTFMPVEEVTWYESPFTSSKVILLLPLGRRELLAGRLDKEGPNPFMMDAETVGLVNMLVAQSAKQIYSATDDFV